MILSLFQGLISNRENTESALSHMPTVYFVDNPVLLFNHLLTINRSGVGGSGAILTMLKNEPVSDL